MGINQEFLHMFGFSKKELAEQFNNHFTEMVNPADREHKDMKQLQQNENVTFHFRVLCKTGNYKWVTGGARLSLTEDGKEQLFLVILDTEIDKETIDNLRVRAEHDALTSLYNREETQRQINRHLKQKPDTICAFFIIDTDNFKQINDNLGHLFGDTVLKEMADGMKHLMRQSDVVGRIGGDEFIIFLKDIESAKIAETKATKLLEVFRGLFRGEKTPVKVSCSIGVSLYPKDGNDFKSLYKNADSALYGAKKKGKNQFVMFREDDLALAYTEYSVLGAKIDSNQETVGEIDGLASYLFQILYDAEDLNHALEQILAIVGKKYDVSRAYVFENSEDGKYCNNTYEWCNERALLQKENLQHCSYENFDGYDELFEDSAIFYCRDIYALKPRQTALLEGQGIYSTLQCAIRNKGTFAGFVGFDECTGERTWTKKEIGVLSLVSQMLTIFLQRKRMAELDQKFALKLNTILDKQSAYVYVIRKDNYELLYMSKKVMALEPSAKVGMTCYCTFLKKDQPCEHCPLTGTNNEGYISKYHMWVDVHVSSMKWEEYDAYLVTCFDISKYKNIEP